MKLTLFLEVHGVKVRLTFCKYFFSRLSFSILAVLQSFWIPFFYDSGHISQCWPSQSLQSYFPDRIYDDFWTQTPVRMAEFSDRPMALPPPDDDYWGFFPAKYTTAYLEAYVDNHIYNGQTIRDRIIFEAPVKRIEKTSEGSWAVFHSDGHSLQTKKLIDATGMTSKPYVPELPGSKTFQGLRLHHKAFGQSTFLSDPTKKHVVVLGGAKSAADVAYASAKAGKTISWIVREDGNGPAAFFAPQPVNQRYANSNEGFYNRYLASFLPNPFGSKSFLSMILHGTWFGRIYLKRLWDGFDMGLRGVMNYHREEGKEMGFANLEPDTPYAPALLSFLV